MYSSEIDHYILDKLDYKIFSQKAEIFASQAKIQFYTCHIMLYNNEHKLVLDMLAPNASFDRSLLVIKQGHGMIQSSPTMNVSANEIIYDIKSRIITAREQVELFTSEYSLRAPEIIVDQVQQKIFMKRRGTIIL